MKIAIFGSGRVDISGINTDPEIKDPFLHLCRALCLHFNKVTVEINVPLEKIPNEAHLRILGNLEVGFASKYHSFLGYFANPRNFTPYKIALLNKMIKQADVVVLRIPGPVLFLAYLLCRWHKRPYLTFVASDLYNVAGNLTTSLSLRSRLRGHIIGLLCLFLKFKVLRNANRRLYLSNKMQDDYEDYHNAKSALFSTSIVEKIHDFKPAAVLKSSIRCVFVGRLVAEKGIADLLDICNRLCASGLHVHLDVIGDGREADKFSMAVEALCHPKLQVFAHGWLSDRQRIEDLLLDADFCLLPSRNEGTPKVIFESWASSTIFVGTRVGGIPAALEDGKYGILFDVGDTESAVAQMLAMINNPDQINKLNRLASEKVKNFTLSETAKKLALEIEACYR